MLGLDEIGHIIEETMLSGYDFSFKVLIVGDSGVGKSSLLLRFISSKSVQDLSPTIGVDFKVKQLTVGGKRLKLTIWDTAGQERFGVLTSSYYRGAHGIVLVYDVTERESFTNLSNMWAKNMELNITNDECIKILIGNKIDSDKNRAVSKEEGELLAEEYDSSFFECSAVTSENVHHCFKQLLLQILEKPSLVRDGSMVVEKRRQKWREAHSHKTKDSPSCCY